jgi:CHAT domain
MTSVVWWLVVAAALNRGQYPCWNSAVRRRQLPPTSYGYIPPVEAVADGWRCWSCGQTDQPAPRRWPFPCPECAEPTDPTFVEPWDHEAEGFRLKHVVQRGGDHWTMIYGEPDLHRWSYEDALRRADPDAVAAAKIDIDGLRRSATSLEHGWPAYIALSRALRTAVEVGDLDFAAQQILAWHGVVDTDDLENDRKNDPRAIARTFVGVCVAFLESPASMGHPAETKVDAAMRDIAARAASVITTDNGLGIQRTAHLRARASDTRRFAELNRLGTSTTLGLAARLPGSTAARWLEQVLSLRSPRAIRRRIRVAELAVAAAKAGRSVEPAVGAVADLLRLVTQTDVDRTTRHRAATVLADAALVAAEVRDDPNGLDAVAERIETVDTSLSCLVHLLRARAELASAEPGPAAADELREAIRAAQGPTRPLLPEIHSMLGMLLAEQGRSEQGIAMCRAGRRHGLRLLKRVTSADIGLARLLTRHALQADDPPEARVQHLREAVRLSRRHCRRRSGGPDAMLALDEAVSTLDIVREKRGRVVGSLAWSTTAQRSATAPIPGRMRQATAWVAWALGTDHPDLVAEAYGHLISLIPSAVAVRSSAVAQDAVLVAAQEHTEEAGYWLTKAGHYREAVVALETGRAIALSLVDAGTDAEPVVSYEDITTVNDDGAVVYLAAAKAGGYALVVAGRHDPQFVELPRFDRASIRSLLAEVLPSDDPGTRDGRDVGAEQETPHTFWDGRATWLWHNGLGDILHMDARGQMVTLVPIGLFSLLPLHATGISEDVHAGSFSAVRYAPNVRTLRRCRETARELAGTTPVLLAADVPDGHLLPPGKHLAGVARETADVAAVWAGHDRTSHVAHDCTWDDFRHAADGCSVWHVACHGSTRPDDRLSSELFFADTQVTLDRLARTVRPAPRRLAVLSACESHLTDAYLPNENAGLPATLLRLGFAGVIATTWSIDDAATPYLMAAFYRIWCSEDAHPAIALNRAQGWLARATRAELARVLPDMDPIDGDAERPFADPRFWAAFAYTGA